MLVLQILILMISFGLIQEEIENVSRFNFVKEEDKKMKPSNRVIRKATLAIVFIMFSLTATFQPQAAIAQSAKDMKAMAERIPEIWNKEGNLAVIDELYSPEIVRHTISNQDQVGLDAYKDWVTSSRTTYTDINVKTDQVFVEDDRVLWNWTWTGTNTGPLGELPATGKKVQVSGVFILRIVDGKIVEEWQYWNNALVLTQLGFTFSPPADVSEKQRTLSLISNSG